MCDCFSRMNLLSIGTIVEKVAGFHISVYDIKLVDPSQSA